MDFEEVSNPYQVELESTETFAFNAIGYPNTGSFDSNAFLTLKGHFSDGGSCLVNAKRVPYRFIGNENATCDSFYVGLKPITVVKGQEKLDVLFNNPLAYDATLLLYSDNGNVSPSKLIIPGDTVQMHTLYLSNTQKNQTLTIQTSIPGCVIPAQTSTLFFSGLENAPVQFVNPPSVLIIGTANEFALQVENNSAFTQEVELTMIAKPSGATFTKKLSIGGLDEPLIYLPTLNLHNQSLAVIQLKSAGYVVSHTIQLQAPAQPVQPTPVQPQTPVQVVSGIITGFVTGGVGFWIGIIILLALVGSWYAQREKTPVVSKDEIILAKPKSPASIDAEEWEEPWMNPGKE